MFKVISKLSWSVSSKTGCLGVLYTQTESVGYRAADLWKSVLSVSNQGSKKGRGKRMGRAKDLNMGQTLGDGKLQVKYPGLNEEIPSVKNLRPGELPQIRVIGEDVDREKRLTELRNKMDRFKRMTVSPFERGFSGSSLAGKPLGPPVSYDDVDFSKFETRLIMYKSMMQHKSILGKKKTITCFVITGNGNGILGYGTGRGSTGAGAVKMAKSHASQRLLYINRYEDRTLFHNFYEEYYYTKVFAEKKASGYGLVCHRIIKKICELAGIKDVYAKVEGSQNPRNVAKAFIGGLINQKKYQDIADEKNLHVVEIKPELNNFPVLLAQAKKPIIEDKLQSNDYQKNIDLYLFQNRFRGEKKKKKPFYATYDSYKRYCALRDKDNAQKKARVHRLALLPDELIMAQKYPRRPKPKSTEEAAE